jgi:hypothetical protein
VVLRSKRRWAKETLSSCTIIYVCVELIHACCVETLPSFLNWNFVEAFCHEHSARCYFSSKLSFKLAEKATLFCVVRLYSIAVVLIRKLILSLFIPVL